MHGSKGSLRGRNKDCRKFIAAIEESGGVVKITKGGHLKVTGPLGVVVTGSKISSGTSWRNAIATLRTHAGVDVRIPN